MLKISDLKVTVDGKAILNGINLEVGPGEVHAIMGPNGSGKSTLANVIAGRDDYEVTNGSVTFMGNDLLSMAPEDRAREGVFLAFQYPVEIPGVANIALLKEGLNAARRHRGEPQLDALDFLKLVRGKLKLVEVKEEFAYPSGNEGVSSGEKKRTELFQMAMLEPSLAVLDETDSGLDIDALKTVAGGVNALRSEDRSIILVTHYQRLLDYIVPDPVHVLAGGKILRSGDKQLALDLEERGYGWIETAADAATA